MDLYTAVAYIKFTLLTLLTYDDMLITLYIFAFMYYRRKRSMASYQYANRPCIVIPSRAQVDVVLGAHKLQLRVILHTGVHDELRDTAITWSAT